MSATVYVTMGQLARQRGGFRDYGRGYHRTAHCPRIARSRSVIGIPLTEAGTWLMEPCLTCNPPFHGRRSPGDFDPWVYMDAAVAAVDEAIRAAREAMLDDLRYWRDQGSEEAAAMLADMERTWRR